MPRKLPRAFTASAAAGRRRSAERTAAGADADLTNAQAIARGYRPNHTHAARYPPVGETSHIAPKVRSEIARLGLHAFHSAISIGDRRGWPDWTIWGPAPWPDGRPTIIFRELKGTGGLLSVAQATVIDQLAAAGADVAVWWPEDYHLGNITTTLETLAATGGTSRHRTLTPGRKFCGCPMDANVHTCELWGPHH